MKKTPYQEALRFMANAKETLKNAKLNHRYNIYEDVKYVQTASGIAYLAVVIAVSEYLFRKEGNKYKKPKSIEDMTSRLTKINKKVLSLLLKAYDELHLFGYYNGTTSPEVIKTGFDHAFEIIEHIKD